MPRPTSQYKAAKTVAANKGTKPFSDWYTNWFTSSKQDIIAHPARNISMCAAKGPGKTELAIATIMRGMEEHPDSSGLALRKYSKGAVASLAQTALNITTKAKAYGVKMPEYKRSTDRVIRQTNKMDVIQNQAIILGSFENLEGISGISPPKAGFFNVVFNDELVPMNDRGKAGISDEDWRFADGLIVDSVSRHNDDYLARHPKAKIPATRYIYSFNPFTPHPELTEMNEVYSESDWMDFVTGIPDVMNLSANNLILCKEYILESMKKNTIGAVYIEERDKLYVRMTKLESPMQNKKPELYERMFVGLVNRDYKVLSADWGIQYKGLDSQSKWLPVWDIDDYNIKTMQSYKDEGYEVESVSIGIDIDTSRVLTYSPVVAYVKRIPVIGEVIDIKFHVAPIIEQEVNGSGSKGQNLRPMADMIREVLSHLKKHFKCNNMTAQIDDTRKEMISLVDEMGPDVEEAYYEGIMLGKPIKKGSTYGLVDRQDRLRDGIIDKHISIDPANSELVQDMIDCVRERDSDARYTLGTKNYLDRIDPTDYGLEPYAETLQYL